MAQVAEQELQQLPEFIESCSMVYIPEVGYLLGLPHWDANLTDDQLKSLPNLQFMVVCATFTPSLDPPLKVHTRFDGSIRSLKDNRQ